MSGAQPLVLAQGTAMQMPLRNQSVNTIITSPPYYGLRQYNGLKPQIWQGGSYRPTPGAPPIVIPGPTVEEMASCQHVWGEEKTEPKRGHPGDRSTLGGTQTSTLSKEAVAHGATCQHCGAWRGYYGNEDTPARYLWHTLLWLREAWRVLRDDGILWLIVGDCYSAAGKSGGPGQGDRWTLYGPDHIGPRGGKWHTTPGYTQGSLLGIPGRIHQAALAAGWTVRNDVVWAKAAPMPEPLQGWRWQQERCACVSHARGQEPYRNGTWQGRPQSDHDPDNHKNFAPAHADPNCPTCHGTGHTDAVVLRRGSWRHTRAHETVLMLTKGMSYFANSEAVREALADTNAQRTTAHYNTATRYGVTNGGNGGLDGLAAKMREGTHTGRNPRSVLHEPPSPSADLAALRQWLTQHCPEVLNAYEAAQRNPDSILTPKPSSFAGQHYATFPAGLLEPLMKASCPERVCRACGEPWAPVVTSEGGRDWHQDRMKANGWPGALNGEGGYKRGQSREALNDTQCHTVHGLAPTCPCVAKWKPGIVLDCFVGSGTTLEVAQALGRRAIGVDLSYQYLATLARERLGLVALAAWEGRHGYHAPETFVDLPLFAVCSTM